MTELQGIKILAFTWNTDGLSICEKNIPGSVKSPDRDVKSNFDWKHPFTTKKCALPDFMKDLRVRLDTAKGKGEQPHIMIFSTQGEPETKSYFAEFLQDFLSQHDYYRISYEKLKGISEVQSGGKKRLTDDTTGAIRQSIFVEKNFHQYVKKVKKVNTYNLFKTESEAVSQNATGKDKSRNIGALVTYLNIFKYGVFGFITVHLPSGIKRFGIEKGSVHDTDYQYYRETMTAANRMFMLHIVKKFIIDIKEKIGLNYMLMMGDFNYGIAEPIDLSFLEAPSGFFETMKSYFAARKNPSRVSSVAYMNAVSDILAGIPLNQRATAMGHYAQELYKYDELHSEFGKSETRLKMFQEGVNNMGPTFLPNWRLDSVDATRTGKAKFMKRESDCLSTNKNIINCYDKSEEHVAWKDRILYSSSSSKPSDLGKLVCRQYELYDSNNITYSDHAAILGIFTIDNPQEILADDKFHNVVEIPPTKPAPKSTLKSSGIPIRETKENSITNIINYAQLEAKAMKLQSTNDLNEIEREINSVQKVLDKALAQQKRLNEQGRKAKRVNIADQGNRNIINNAELSNSNRKVIDSLEKALSMLRSREDQLKKSTLGENDAEETFYDTEGEEFHDPEETEAEAELRQSRLGRESIMKDIVDKQKEINKKQIRIKSENLNAAQIKKLESEIRKEQKDVKISRDFLEIVEKQIRELEEKL